jgi:Rrf2 family nitric oxide-sensitive transcriptional repressor
MPSILSEATAAFIGVFDKYTVADLVRRRELLRSLLAA